VHNIESADVWQACLLQLWSLCLFFSRQILEHVHNIESADNWQACLLQLWSFLLFSRQILKQVHNIESADNWQAGTATKRSIT
jgi:hypothetical protein